MKKIALLGSTGSIGTQTLEMVRKRPTAFGVEALCAGTSWEAVLRQVREFRPRWVGLADARAADRLRGELPSEVELVAGPAAAERIAVEADYDLAVHGIVGAAGVRPSLRVLERGLPLALANKESLVVAGAPLMEVARATGAAILPVDSEHCALFQCLRGEDLSRVRRVLLTASGGPFRDTDLGQLADVTPQMALRHPNWEMGPRITIGSATLMNKAFEVVETHHLFGLEPEKIDVVLHRQSVCHSMVEFRDGSVLAQLGPPDMRGPIHFAMTWPERPATDLPGFDFELFSSLTFEPVDPLRFPCLELGYECVRRGGVAGAVLNASDEVAVQAFLKGRIRFQEIAELNRTILESVDPDLEGAGEPAQEVEALLEADRRARSLAEEEIARRARVSPASADCP